MAHKITDRAGKEWTIDPTIETVYVFEKETNFELLVKLTECSLELAKFDQNSDEYQQITANFVKEAFAPSKYLVPFFYYSAVPIEEQKDLPMMEFVRKFSMPTVFQMMKLCMAAALTEMGVRDKTMPKTTGGDDDTNPELKKDKTPGPSSGS